MPHSGRVPTWDTAHLIPFLGFTGRNSRQLTGPLWPPIKRFREAMALAFFPFGSQQMGPGTDRQPAGSLLMGRY